jgi:hypothetical protein
MCSRHEPEAGADSGAVINFLPNGGHEWVREPVQATCGHWVERGDIEGFCGLPPGHLNECLPPRYEVND